MVREAQSDVLLPPLDGVVLAPRPLSSLCEKTDHQCWLPAPERRAHRQRKMYNGKISCGSPVHFISPNGRRNDIAKPITFSAKSIWGLISVELPKMNFHLTPNQGTSFRP
jgi:hypothetical protein